MAPSMRYRLGMLLSKKPTVEKPAVEETTRLFLDLSLEPFPYNGVRLTLDLIQSRLRLLISETHWIETENLTMANSFRERVKHSVEREQVLRFIADMSTCPRTQGADEPRRDFQFNTGLLAPLGIRSI
ncbi:hypothetical protein V8E54_001337 [Elaphomyces granulatus]